MVRDQKTIGLSREYIIHPGETLQEILEDREMSQRELAIRTGVTEKHISTVIHGQKAISSAFAKKLEYALGIEASFWMNLQTNYDQEILEFEELNNISKEELGLLKNLKDVIVYWSDLGWIDTTLNSAAQVIDLRVICGVSNLLDIPRTNYVAAYRAQVKKGNIDPYTLFAWQKMCEKLTDDIVVADQIDVEKLKDKIPEIKQAMFLRANQIQKKLERIFAECGISFMIVPNFKGAPVQGLIKKKDNGSLMLCITLRQKFADIFWFTLFHEISHIINGDTKTLFVDFDSVSSETEEKADNMAREFLIDSKAYKNFIDSGDYSSLRSIESFAESQNVKPYIVQGRLMKEKKIPWNCRLRYDWA